MDFTYSIDEYVPANNMLYVMYTPVSTGIIPRAKAVYIVAEAILNEDAAAIHKAVIEQAPIDEWIQEKDIVADDHTAFLQSLTGSHTAKSLPVPQATMNYDTHKIDEAAPPIDNPGIEHNYFNDMPLTTDELEVIIRDKHQAVRLAADDLLTRHINQHDSAFDDTAPAPPLPDIQTWVDLVHAEAAAKIAAIVVSTDPVDLVFAAEGNIPPALEV